MDQQTNPKIPALVWAKPLEWRQVGSLLEMATPLPGMSFSIFAEPNERGTIIAKFQGLQVYRGPDPDRAKRAANNLFSDILLDAVEVADMGVTLAAHVLLSDDIALCRMAQAMHDGPLGADDNWFSASTNAGAFCLDMARAGLRAIERPTAEEAGPI